LERLLFNHKGHKGFHKGAQRVISRTFVFFCAVLRAPLRLILKLGFSTKVNHYRKPIIIIVLINFFFQFLPVEGISNNSQNLFPPPDSLPPAPPGQAEELTGPALACVGDVSKYSIDVPVACTCQWAVNNVIQPETGSTLTITWAQPGPQTISVVFICAGGQTSDPESLSVSVFETPEQPGPISGDQYVCEYTYHTYSTVVDPSDSCQWTVNGAVQPGYSSSLTYLFSEEGIYHFEVTAYNPCGTSIARTLNVTASSSVPPVVFLGNDTTIMQGQTLILDAGNPGSDYLWSTGATTQTLPINVTGTYSVFVSNSCGTDADTINVSFYVGLNEYVNNNADCFPVACNAGTLSFPGLLQKDIRIQLVNLSGNVYYEGPPKELRLDGHGIWLIRFISPDKSCYRKILIF
jgi:hypothetical protein